MWISRDLKKNTKDSKYFETQSNTCPSPWHWSYTLRSVHILYWSGMPIPGYDTSLALRPSRIKRNIDTKASKGGFFSCLDGEELSPTQSYPERVVMGVWIPRPEDIPSLTLDGIALLPSRLAQMWGLPGFTVPAVAAIARKAFTKFI